MNIKNNLRYKRSSKKIEEAFLELLKKFKYEEISISQICKKANINRSTFYCHYDDINDLIITIEGDFAKGTAKIFNYGERQTNEDLVEMFNFIKENKYFYKAFLNIPYITFAEKKTKKECLDNLEQKFNIDKAKKIELFYRANFFGAGIKEICRLWLERNCKEPPEQMASLMINEYADRSAGQF